MKSALRWLRFPKHGRVRGTLRVVALLSIVNVAITATYCSSSTARAEKSVERAGQELLTQLGPLLVGPPQAVTINGQRMFLASKTTEESVTAVLDRFQGHCDGQDPASGPMTPMDWSPWELLTSRLEDESTASGHVACLKGGRNRTSVSEFVAQLTEFVKTFDLSQLGEMRYAVARRDGKTGKTHVLSMWTEGRFVVPEMFPADRDAPGSDSSVLPRPPSSIRVLSAELPEQPYALRMYDSTQEGQQVLDYYARVMPERGYLATPLPTVPESYDLNQNVRVFMKGGVAVLVLTNVTPAGKTGVSLMELGSAGFARATTAGAP